MELLMRDCNGDCASFEDERRRRRGPRDMRSSLIELSKEGIVCSLCVTTIGLFR